MLNEWITNYKSRVFPIEWNNKCSKLLKISHLRFQDYIASLTLLVSQSKPVSVSISIRGRQLFFVGSDTDDMSPYPTVVMVTTAHQKPSGIDLK